MRETPDVAAAVPVTSSRWNWSPQPTGTWPRLSYDSKVFETKFAQERHNQWSGKVDGHGWREFIRCYLIGRLPAVKHVLKWAEQHRGKEIATAEVANLRAHMDEDPVVVGHLLWAFFNVNLTDKARDIFCNVEESHGLEVWRRVVSRIDYKGENRLDELYNLIHHPRGVSKCEDVAQALEDWDTNQRLYRNAGGTPLRDDELKNIVKKIIPEVIRDQIILTTHQFPGFHDMKEYIKEKARALVVAKSAKTTTVNLVEEEFSDEILEMSLDDAVEALGDPSTEVILALVQKMQQ